MNAWIAALDQKLVAEARVSYTGLRPEHPARVRAGDDADFGLWLLVAYAVCPRIDIFDLTAADWRALYEDNLDPFQAVQSARRQQRQQEGDS